MASRIEHPTSGRTGGVAVKAPCVAVSQEADLALRGLPRLGPYAVHEGDRVLVKDQTDATQNGVYNASASAWTRARDFDGTYDPLSGTLVVTVLSNGLSLFYQLQASTPVVFGSSRIHFVPVYIGPQVHYPQTPEEMLAGVTPGGFNYPELDVRRYGAASGNSGAQNAAALQNAVRVLARKQWGELLVPEGLVLPLTQVQLDGLTHFNIRCDGVITSTAQPPGPAFTHQPASQGAFTPLKLTHCSGFKIYGRGSIDPGCVDALYLLSCSDFDLSLDCRGTGRNNNLHGIYLQFCFQFRIHDMTVDSITAQNMQDALNMTAAPAARSTTATATSWAAGAGTFDTVFAAAATGETEIRLVTYGSGTRNVSMSWHEGLANDSRAAFHAEIYYGWLNNLAILSCHDFRVNDVISRKAGGNGLYVLSVGGAISSCYNFELSGNTCERNSESGIQITWAGGTTPNNYTCNNNILRYNQADGIDAANTSGARASIWAQFNGNQHYCNGWINCNPDNPGGQDGSGLGTFFNVANFEAIGGIVYEPNNAGIAVANAESFRIANVAITKTRPGGHQQGIVLLAPITGGTIENVDCTTAGLGTLLMQPATDVTLSRLRLTGGPTAFGAGEFAGCRMKESSIHSTTALEWLFDIIDCNIIVTGTNAQGLIARRAGVHCVRNTIASQGNAVDTNGQADCVIENTTATASAGGIAINVNGSNGCRVQGCTAIAQGSSTAAFGAQGRCDRTTFIDIKGNCATGHSLLVSAQSTNTILIGLTSIHGPSGLGGTYLLKQP